MIKPFKLQRFNNVSTNLTDIWFYLIPDQHSCATDYHEDSNTMGEPRSFKNCWYWWTIRSSNIGEQIWCIWILLEIKCNKIVPFQYTNSENVIRLRYCIYQSNIYLRPVHLLRQCREILSSKQLATSHYINCSPILWVLYETNNSFEFYYITSHNNHVFNQN